MKKFLLGFLRNFAILLIAWKGYTLWQDGYPWLAIGCFAFLAAAMIWLVVELRKRQQRD